jgi:pilus assembly protein CpaF
MIKLTITEKGGEAKALSFDKDEISIGRVTGNDIVLPKGNVSKRHSKLVFRNDQMEVADLKSTNGTYVNGRKITDPTIVTAADKIYVGDFLIVLEGTGASAVASSSPNGEGASASRRLPIPPPPPLPRVTSTGIDIDEDDDEEGLGGLAMRPPSRSGRVPVPPPPPPPRRTPLANDIALGEDDSMDMRGDLAPPSPSDVAVDQDDGSGGQALFGRGAATANRHDAALPRDGYPSTGVTSPGEGAGELDALMGDPAVSLILISGTDPVMVERGGRLEPLATPFADLNAVADAIWRIASTGNPPPPADNPVIDVRLMDGTRISAVFPPAAPAGLCAAIRKAALPDRALADLGPAGTMTKEIQAILEAAIAGQRNVLVTGDSGAVAAVLGSIAGAIPAERRVVSIGAGLARSRRGWTELAPAGDMAALVRVAAAFNADHLLVAESGGPEVLDLLVAAARGQEGVIFGLVARSSAEAVARVEALALQNLGATAIPQLANSTIDVVVHAVSLAEGGTRIVEVSEVKLDGSGRLGADPVLLWRSEGARRSASGGKMQIIGVSSRLAAALAASGGSLPSNLIRK